jgi:hypothetical protein
MWGRIAQIFQKSKTHLKSLHQKSDMKVPYLEPTNVRHHHTKLIHLGDLALRICAPLVWGMGGAYSIRPMRRWDFKDNHHSSKVGAVTVL